MVVRAHRRECGDVIVGDVEDCEMRELGDVPTDLSELIVSQVEPLQRMHPAVGTTNG